MHKPIISYTAQDGIQELIEEFGIEPTPEQVVRLNYLGSEVDYDNKHLEQPVEVGNVLLYPPSIMALVWFQKHSEVFVVSKHLRIIATAFAFAHGRGKPVKMPKSDEMLTLDEIEKHDDAFTAVKQWMKNLTVTVEELENALDRFENDIASSSKQRARGALLEVLAYFEGNIRVERLVDIIFSLIEHDEDKESFDLNEICLEMAAVTGTTVNFWNRNTIAAAYRAYKAALDRRKRESGGELEIENDVIVKSKRFRDFIKEIIDHHKKIPSGELGRQIYV